MQLRTLYPHVLALLFLCQQPVAAATAARVTAVSDGKTLLIAGQISSAMDEVEVRIATSRNAPISRISDVSPRTPAASKNPSPFFGKREVFYPVVDVALQPGMEGVVNFRSAPELCYVNQNFHRAAVTPGKQIVVPGERLGFWENSVFVEPGTVVMEKFYLRFRVPVVHGSFHRQIALLSEQWSGQVSCHLSSGEEIASAAVTAPSSVAKAAPSGDGLAPARLRESVVESIRYVLRSQDLNPTSATFGGLHLFYDLDARTYRSNHWIWGWGPAVRLLLEGSRVPEIAARFAPGQLLRVADEIGKASLRFMVEDPSHPARGVPVSRWNRNLNFATGFEERISVADALFLAGWAWLPLHRETANAAYLNAAKTLTEATDRLAREFEVVPQDYYHDIKKWSDHILDESGFGMLGVAELYATTKDTRHRDIGLNYFESVRKKLERPDGVWERGWHKTEGIQPAIYVTRGMGWAMTGLLAAHQASPDAGYLERAKRLADQLMRWQHPDGSWSFNADKKVTEVGVAEKATALWSHLFIKLHAATGDARHLASARSALQWCVDNQYFGPDVEARGSLPGIGPASAVGYRQWYEVACTYTTGFFGVAALEELKRKR
jgi:rhamnogalacturonyl hydrolase YesR